MQDRWQNTSRGFHALAMGALLILPIGCGVTTSKVRATASSAVRAIDPNWKTQVNYLGRFDHSQAAGPRCSWSGSALEAAFEGTDISIALARTGLPADSGLGTTYLDVRIDQEPASKLALDHDGTYRLASDLPAGPHRVRVTKRNEAFLGQLQYQGFAVGNGQLLSPPARPARRIEFIGDSISCGYGNEASKATDRFTTLTENVDAAYDMLTANNLSAEPCIVAWSGKGAFMNYGGGRDDLMPKLYARALADEASSLWDFSQWTPQVVVINLGTNDFSNLGRPGFSAEAFAQDYQALVANVRSHYPQAHIFCAVGPMLSGDALAAAVGAIQGGVVQPLNAAGDARIHFIQFPTQDGSDGYGADWHPSAARHQKMAQALTAEIQAVVGEQW